MKEKHVINIDNILTATDWIDRTGEEIGLGADGNEIYYDVKGAFFSYSANGSCSFRGKNSVDEPVLSRVSATVKKCSISEIYNSLMDLYGGPIDAGMEPYAKSNGGAVRWFCFDAGKAVVKISQGSETDYLVLEITKNPNPSDTEKLVIRKTAGYSASEALTGMALKILDYCDGIVTAVIVNKTEGSVICTDKFDLARSNDNGHTYGYLNKTGFQFAVPLAGQKRTIPSGDEVEMTCDLRNYGKITAGKYMLIIDGMKAEFELISENDDMVKMTVAPWFCPECGKKNADTLVCAECGAKKE